MYQVDDLIMYGDTGVCKVKEITVPNFKGTEHGRLYYVLKPLYQDCTIYAPVDSPYIFTRNLISREEAEHLIDSIPSINAEAYHSETMQDLVDHYQASLQTHDCAALMELSMSIYAKKRYMEARKHKIGQVDDKFMKLAENILFGELSVALGVPRDKVQEYISSRVDGLKKHSERVAATA